MLVYDPSRLLVDHPPSSLQQQRLQQQVYGTVFGRRQRQPAAWVVPVHVQRRLASPLTADIVVALCFARVFPAEVADS